MVFTEFQIVDDKTGLVGAIHIETGLGAHNYYFDLGPGTRFEVDVRLILARVFIPQFLPRKVWLFNVLGRVVALELRT